MSIDLDMLQSLVDAGVSAAQLLVAVRAMEAPKQRKRKADAERMRARRGADLFDDVGSEIPEQAEQYAQMSQNVANVAECRGDTPSPPPPSSFSPIPPHITTPPLPTPAVAEAENAREALENALVSQEALDAAEAIGREAGFEPETTPPGWCGAASYIQAALTAGDSMNHIRIACSTILRRCQQQGRAPPDRFGYFRKPIAEICAELRRAAPKVIEPKLEVIHGGKSNAGTGTYQNGGRRSDGHSRNYGSATDAASDLRQYFARRAEEEERAADGNDRGGCRTIDGSLSP